MLIFNIKTSLVGVFTAYLTINMIASTNVFAQSNASIMVASTTSTEQSGLFNYLLPEFKKASGIDVKVVALGTGQALDMGRRGDADVLFVHDKAAEEKLVADGFAVKRFPVMYNDFVLIGPVADPAKVKGKDIVEAMKKVAAGNGISSHAVTKAARMLRNFVIGRKLGLQSLNSAATNNAVAAWVKR